ncbi:MAG: hypothetical protein ABEJ36_00300 [Candidatus Nanosalina sp.]
MNREELEEKIRDSRIESAVVLAGILNGVYSLAVQNWLGLLVSLALVAYMLPEVLKEEE